MSRFFSSIGISIGFSSWRQHWDFAGGPVAKTLSSQCRGFRFSRGQETRSHMLQLRVWMLQLKILYATAKTQSCQTKKNKILLKKEKNSINSGMVLSFTSIFLSFLMVLLPDPSNFFYDPVCQHHLKQILPSEFTKWFCLFQFSNF